MAARKAVTSPKKTAEQPKKVRKPIQLPTLPIFLLMVWAWASFHYDCVLQICRDYSFWSTDSRMLEFLMTQTMAPVRYAGRMLLQVYKYPLLGGLLMAVMLTACSGFIGYILRLSPKLRALQYVPALAYMGGLTYMGLDTFFEAEAGYVMGIPLVATIVLGVCALVVRLTSRKAATCPLCVPEDEKPAHSWIQLAAIALIMAAVVGYGEWQRPYVRVITKMMLYEQEGKWKEMQKLARKNAIQSNRPMAAYYAISLLHTDELGYRLFDIRMDYDSLFLHGYSGELNNSSSLYVPECSFHAGFVQTAYHNCMEQMVMTGPTVRLLKLMTRCALAKNEWDLARKYLRILQDVPFEEGFCKKHEAMTGSYDKVGADPVIAKLRLTEPINDSFESQYQTPIFMGYNINLTEGRSVNALHQSLLACLYTKLMPQFVARLRPIAGSTPPDIIADGILLASHTEPSLTEHFPNLNLRAARLNSYIQSIQPYMHDRAGNAYKLFEKHKGYYPYYYYFGNLKATKKGYTGSTSSSSGVN